MWQKEKKKALSNTLKVKWKNADNLVSIEVVEFKV